METHYTVTRHPKSMGIALLLTFLLGPVGLFYSSVVGGLILCGVPLLIVLVTVWITISKTQALIFLLPFTYFYSVHIYATLLFIYCSAIVWAAFGVFFYNKKLLTGSIIHHTLLSGANTSELESNVSANTSKVLSYGNNKKDRYIYTSIISILLITVSYFILDKYYYQRQGKNEVTIDKLTVDQLTPLYSMPDIKSRVVSILQKGEEIHKLGETLYFHKVRTNDEKGTTQIGFIKKQKSMIEAKEKNFFGIQEFTNGSIDQEQLTSRMGNLIKKTLDNQMNIGSGFSSISPVSNKVLWVESVKDESDYPCFKTVFNSQYFNQITESEKATLAYIATFINTNCQFSKSLNQCNETSLVKSADEMVNSRTENMYCGLLNALDLGHFGSQKHHKFLEKWFSNDMGVMKSLKESYSVTQNDASNGIRMSSLNITTSGSKITLSYKGEIYSSKSSYERPFKEQSVFEHGKYMKVIRLGPVLKQMSNPSER